ncbi:MAG: lactate utilization protein C [Solirubrobacteraceae bacterium]
MSEARDVVLARIREAVADDVPAPDVPRAYVTRGSRPADEVVALFVERVEEAGGVVVTADDAPAAIASTLAEHGASRVVVAPDLEPDIRPDGVDLVEDHGLTPAELDALDGAVTSCAVACADTGTIGLDGGPGQGRRAITLVPDLHVCVVRRGQVVETVPELFERLERSAREGRPIVLVSGPSATSDLGFERVEGVHGPRRLVIVLAP